MYPLLDAFRSKQLYPKLGLLFAGHYLYIHTTSHLLQFQVYWTYLAWVLKEAILKAERRGNKYCNYPVGIRLGSNDILLCFMETTLVFSKTEGQWFLNLIENNLQHLLNILVPGLHPKLLTQKLWGWQVGEFACMIRKLYGCFGQTHTVTERRCPTAHTLAHQRTDSEISQAQCLGKPDAQMPRVTGLCVHTDRWAYLKLHSHLTPALLFLWSVGFLPLPPLPVWTYCVPKPGPSMATVLKVLF